MSTYWINVMTSIHEIAYCSLLVSFIASILLFVMYFLCAVDKDTDLRACKIIEKSLAYTVSILIVSGVVYVMSSPIE